MDEQTLIYLIAMSQTLNRILKTNIIGHESVRETPSGIYDSMQPYFQESLRLVEACKEAEAFFRHKFEAWRRPTMD